MEILSPFESLVFLFDECIQDQSYQLKNKYNYIHNAFNTNLKQAIFYKQQLNDLIYTQDYQQYIDYLNQMLILTPEGIQLDVDIESVSLQQLKEIIEQCVFIGKLLEQGEQAYIDNINILINQTFQPLNRSFIFNKYRQNELIKTLYKTIQAYCFNHYNYENIQSFASVDEKLNDYTVLFDFYHLLLNDQRETLQLVDDSIVNYEQARELCNDYNETLYYSNLTQSTVLNHLNVTIINYKNYKKYINLNSKANLLSNAKDNIQLLFKVDQHYLISNKAYFAALQDLKGYRGKKYCWICGERLGFFAHTVTCKQHQCYEDYL